MLDEAEMRMIHQWMDIGEPTGIEIVDADDSLSLLNKTITQVRADKACATGY